MTPSEREMRQWRRLAEVCASQYEDARLPVPSYWGRGTDLWYRLARTFSDTDMADWPYTPKGYDCRVIACLLIREMLRTGDAL